MKRLLFVFALLISFSCSKNSDDTPETETSDLYFPPVSSTSWETTSPSELGWDEAALDELYTCSVSKSFLSVRGMSLFCFESLPSVHGMSLFYFESLPLVLGKALFYFESLPPVRGMSLFCFENLPPVRGKALLFVESLPVIPGSVHTNLKSSG